MILRRKEICEQLGVKTWRSAVLRLRDLGIQPKRAGREAYVTSTQLEDAVSKNADGAFVPNWDKL